MGKVTEQQSLLRDMSLGLGVSLVELTAAKIFLGVDRRENLGVSTTGKTIVFSRYFGVVPGTDLTLNLTLYRRNPDYAEPKNSSSATTGGKGTSGQESKA